MEYRFINNKHYYTKHNGMSVPNGHTYKYIEELLKNGLYGKYHIVNTDGSSSYYNYLGFDKQNRRHKFIDICNKKIVLFNIKALLEFSVVIN